MDRGVDRALIFALFLLVLTPQVWGQDESDDDEDDDDESSVIEMGGDDDVDYEGVRIDPYPPAVPAELEEPNRPEPVTVGVWEPPTLKPAQRKELDVLLARRAAEPTDLSLRYRVADFYLKSKWLPQAEAEYLECARLDPTSIRPWESLLKIYGTDAPTQNDEIEEILIGLGGAVPQRRVIRSWRSNQNRADWIPSPRERAARITRAMRELVKLRPDDVTRRRQLMDHLRSQGRYEHVAVEARAILERMPDDAVTRYELAQSLLYIAEQFKADKRVAESTAAMKEVRALLEENVRRSPDHAPSLIRLARVYAVQDGGEKTERIEELENRAFLNLYVVPELGKAAFREDVCRMARNLSGPSMANDVWDRVMNRGDRGWNDETFHVQRWLALRFPHAQPRDRENVIPTLARRGDEAAAVVLLSFLWHLEDPSAFGDNGARARDARRLEAAAILASTQLGGIAFPVAERFLKHADAPVQRRRGVDVLLGIGDTRAVSVLLDTLAEDTNRQFSFGVAAALEELGDARAIDALVAAAADVRRPVDRRREAAEALAAFKDSRSIEALNTLAADGEYATVTAYGLFRLTGQKSALEDLVAMAKSGDRPGELLRLCAKCDRAEVRQVLFSILRVCKEPSVREPALRLVKERYGDEARAEIEALFLREAESVGASDFVIRELGEMGTEAAVEQLLKLANNERTQRERWAVVCRALARTGDPKAVRYFSRRRILEKDPGKRNLATQLYEEAAKRQAQLNR